MKKAILILIGLLVIVGVYAIPEGATYTQEQVDGFDLENRTLNELITVLDCQMIDEGSWIYMNNDYYYHKSFGCISIKPIYDDNGTFESYLTFRANESISVKKSTLKACIHRYGRTKCSSAYDSYFKQKAKTWITNLKYYLMSWQTSDIDMDGSDFYGGLW